MKSNVIFWKFIVRSNWSLLRPAAALNLACPDKFIEDEKRSLTRETYLSSLFNWGES
jgi:hypothetical protein